MESARVEIPISNYLLHNYSLPRGPKEVCLMNCKNFSISEKVDNKNMAGKLMSVASTKENTK
jgi:hypothetical protein